MEEGAITEYITDAFDGVDVVVANGDSFFFNNLGRESAPDHMFPFATLVTSDAHDQVSNLNRPSVFRLNVGVSKDTFRSLFGVETAPAGSGAGDDAGDVEGGYDFSTLDQIMPHPVYGKMFWVCVLNPSAATFEKVRPLLAEAYGLAAKRSSRRQTKRS